MKIKILRIIARLNIGGPAMHTILLSEGLDKAKYDSLLIYGSADKREGEMLDYAARKGIKLNFIPELKRKLNPLDDFIALKKIYRIIKVQKPDIIHTHTAKAGTLGRLAGILFNLFHPHQQIKLVHTFHGHIFEGYFSKFETKIFIFIERFLAFFSAKIITVSQSLKKELVSLKISKEDKIEVIPLGFELDRFLEIQPREDTDLKVGIVGRLAPIKNHFLFLEAAAKIVKKSPEIKVIFKIIGDGELRRELEEHNRKLSLGDKVIFLGWQKDLKIVYSDLDVVVLTSLNEGTPVSLIEAMAAAKAVVATDVGGIRDLLGNIREDFPGEITNNFKILERGVIVGSGDHDSFAAALVFLLQNNQLRKNLGLRGRDFVKNRFTKERLIKDIETCYENLFLKN